MKVTAGAVIGFFGVVFGISILGTPAHQSARGLGAIALVCGGIFMTPWLVRWMFR
jgi:hypothetical protein